MDTNDMSFCITSLVYGRISWLMVHKMRWEIAGFDFSHNTRAILEIRTETRKLGRG